MEVPSPPSCYGETVGSDPGYKEEQGSRDKRPPAWVPRMGGNTPVNCPASVILPGLGESGPHGLQSLEDRAEALMQSAVTHLSLNSRKTLARVLPPAIMDTSMARRKLWCTLMRSCGKAGSVHSQTQPGTARHSQPPLATHTHEVLPMFTQACECRHHSAGSFWQRV